MLKIEIITITLTLTTNKTVITDKILGYWGRKKTKKTKKQTKTKNKTNQQQQQNNNNTYLLHPNYEKTTLSNMQRKHHVH